MIAHLRRLLEYDVWANRETLDSLRQGDTPPKSRRWMSHVIGAEYLWHARLRGESSRFPVWPDLDLETSAGCLEELSRLWPEALADAKANGLSRRVSYTNSKGETWSSAVEEILTHVTIHSAYHRGQIASDLRSAGFVPAYTDYIHAVRQGLIR